MSANLRTPLYDAHLAAGARIVPFAGYDMPVQYASVIAEARAVRTEAGMFDVSHMARLSFEGKDVIEYIEWVTSNDFAKLTEDAGQYSLLPNATGGTVDDIVVFKRSDTKVDMVVNAANHEKDVAWLKSQIGGRDVTLQDHTKATAMIAAQGPKAVETITKMTGDSALADLPAFSVKESSLCGVPLTVSRTGYTGEDGFELVCEAAKAVELWNDLRDAGFEPCGLASRDTLRVEAGLPLYGHELNDELSPLCAGLGWVISKEKKFVGSEEIQKVREGGAQYKLVGIRLEEKRLIPAEAAVFVQGEKVGFVSSGVVSPLFDCAIGMAFVRPDIKFETDAEVDLRGKLLPAKIVNKRFLKSRA